MISCFNLISVEELIKCLSRADCLHILTTSFIICSVCFLNICAWVFLNNCRKSKVKSSDTKINFTSSHVILLVLYKMPYVTSCIQANSFPPVSLWKKEKKKENVAFCQKSPSMEMFWRKRSLLLHLHAVFHFYFLIEVSGSSLGSSTCEEWELIGGLELHAPSTLSWLITWL